MGNLAEEIPQIEDNSRIKETEKTNLKLVKNPEFPIENSMGLLVSKLKEYEKIISDILGEEEKKVEGLADKIENYITDFKNKEYVPGSSFEHIVNNLSMELCPGAKHFALGTGSENDRKAVTESFEAMNDYIDLLLKFESFEKKELKENGVSLREYENLSAVRYVAKRKRELEGETVD